MQEIKWQKLKEDIGKNNNAKYAEATSKKKIDLPKTFAVKFIENLLNLDEIKDLEDYTDQGVKVSTHTYDVLKISIDEIKRDFYSFEEAKKKVDFFSLIIGIIIHDLSKATLRKTEENVSHSQIMLKKPDFIIEESQRVLTTIENKINKVIKEKVKENIVHIVVSHHGRWGKIQPQTREANIVHRSDVYSAKYHRINPIGADKIIELLIKGEKLEEIAKILNCTEGTIKNRLKRSKEQLQCKNVKQLIEYYKNNKQVPIGDHFFIQRVKETDKLKKMVDKKGFKNLVLEIPLLKYLIDEEIFVE
ncbi:sigma factor-like helix-turn-helix DNA-binding protein [Fusobacterium sp. PH5-44]|uniref:helix-turn-helix transcriptional regulator n=1 Tax=unclassified Fusobacterium TaxID=2648384 RepID=UPI003D223D68